MGGNNIAYVPIVDAVQEFNVMPNLYNAEYGHTGGGIMNVVLKSGSNQHPRHGLGVHAPHRRWTRTPSRTIGGTNLDANGKATRPPTIWISTASSWKAGADSRNCCRRTAR